MSRQLELAQRAQQNALKLMADFANLRPAAPSPFAPKPFDHRFDHPARSTPPFLMWQQGFLAVQEWWARSSSLQPPPWPAMIAAPGTYVFRT